MAITSFGFLCFYTVVLILYYIVPGKFQWMILTLASVIYYLLSGSYVLILYPLAAVTVTWLLLLILRRIPQEAVRKRRMICTAELLILLGILIALKYTKFIHGGDLVAPLGLSFYTFILVGYFLDCYNGIAQIQTSFLKLMLYGMYFPLMISGPIVQLREQGEQFFAGHPLSYRNLTCGLQRILWGFFKELVISQRLGLIVDTVYGNDQAYQGPYIWLATVCFAFQLYTNFSGCMDIVIGISETFGIQLPENFDLPFLSRNISEYWRRWHITLGLWMREHVFYPLLRSQTFMKLNKKLRSKYGKKRGKQYNTWIAMLILWTAVGLWHGGDLKYVIGSGWLHCFYIIFGEATLPFWIWLFGKKMHINLEGRFANIVRVIRTFFLVCIGFVFFRASSTMQALRMLREGLHAGYTGIISDGGIFRLGMSWIEWGVTLVSLVILFAVSFYQYRGEQRALAEGTEYSHHSLRDAIAGRKLWVRWLIWFCLLFYVILLGEYGPGYSAAEFIYQGF